MKEIITSYSNGKWEPNKYKPFIEVGDIFILVFGWI